MTLREKLDLCKPRSYWGKGIKAYAEELLEKLEDCGLDVTEENMLNGALNWLQYSEGGLALIHDCHIAERLCSPSELKRVWRKDGLHRPNKQETWLECQARALFQASALLIRLSK